MSSWESEPDAHARPATGGDDPGGAPTPLTDDPPVTAPDALLPPQEPTATMAERVLWEGPVPGDDPLPSTESLLWAPDATEPVPALAPDPPAGSSVFAPRPPAGSDPSGWAHPPDSARHVADGAPQPGGGVPGRWRSDRAVLVSVGVLVAVVVVTSAILLTRDDGGPSDPGESATSPTSLVVGDGTDPAGPIVGPTGVIGSWSGSEWLPRADGEQPGAEHDYAVVGLSDVVGAAPGEAVTEECPAQRATSEVDVAVELDASSGPSPIAVAGVAEPRPREVQQFSTDSEEYRQAAAAVGAGLGATEPPTVSQVLRADLDGDGTFEVVVAAGHVSDPEDLAPAAGDWSAVFLRRVVADGVATDILASSVTGDGDVFDHMQVAALADLNGDGSMEVALEGRSSTGEWSSVHALDDAGVPSEVLRAGCTG